jgi:hypothetical protein
MLAKSRPSSVIWTRPTPSDACVQRAPRICVRPACDAAMRASSRCLRRDHCMPRSCRCQSRYVRRPPSRRAVHSLRLLSATPNTAAAAQPAAIFSQRRSVAWAAGSGGAGTPQSSQRRVTNGLMKQAQIRLATNTAATVVTSASIASTRAKKAAHPNAMSATTATPATSNSACLGPRAMPTPMRLTVGSSTDNEYCHTAQPEYGERDVMPSRTGWPCLPLAVRRPQHHTSRRNMDALTRAPADDASIACKCWWRRRWGSLTCVPDHGAPYVLVRTYANSVTSIY